MTIIKFGETQVNVHEKTKQQDNICGSPAGE